MKRTCKIFPVIALLWLLTFGLWTAQAQTNGNATNAIPPVQLLQTAGNLRLLEQFAANFFLDHTNFWEQKSFLVGADVAYSKGHDRLNSAPSKDTYGGVITVGFPLDANGQVSIGLWAAYFKREAFYGSFQTTLGTTLTMPSWVPLLKGQQFFIFNEGGPGYRLNGDGGMFAQDFVGAVWKHGLGRGWTIFVNGAYGTVTAWDGDVYLFGLKIGKKL